MKQAEHFSVAGPNEVEEVEIDIGEIFRALRRRRWALGGCVLLITSVVLLVTFQLTPLYTATAEVLIDLRDRNVVDLDSVLSGLSSDASTIESQIQVIRSHSLAIRVIETLRLDRDPEFNEALREPGMGAVLQAWLRGLAPGEAEEASEEERLALEQTRLIEAFSEARTVSRVGRKSYVISIAFTSERAAKASQLANTLAEFYLVDQLEAKFNATERATDWLHERLGALAAEVEKSERLVEAYRSEHGLVDSRGITVDEQQLVEINTQLILARADLAEKRARFRHVTELLDSGSGVESVAEVLASTVVHDLRQRQAELAREEAELESRYGDRHPRMINIRAQRKDLEFGVATELQRIVANLENEVVVARSRAQSLERSLTEAQHQRSVGETARIRLRELNRHAIANRTLYESFLGRFNETREQQGIQAADARIISAATVPVEPSYPRKGLFAAAGFLASLIVGAGVVVLLERLDNGFHNSRELEDALGLPLLASIPELSEADARVEEELLSPHDYVLARPLSIYGEAIRGLRTSLMLSNVDVPPRAVLFSSAMASEGKTSIALSLARSIAQSGKRVVVVDADLRRPAVARRLGLRPEAGLIEYLAGQASLDEVIVTDKSSEMDVLPVIQGAANAPDLLGSESMRILLEKLKTDYDLVLVDSPPLLLVSDATVLGEICDKLVFVVRWEQTPRQAALEAVHRLRQFEIDVAGVVLNRVDLKRDAEHYYGDSYYRSASDYYVN
ncbi:MAG: polysaccharide biosynthesis tyrosine autokinase [Myxococcales bacterium]|nr:polysaccharide biosynthesis tyrosine autokinase [Myxococcales bacterium]